MKVSRFNLASAKVRWSRHVGQPGLPKSCGAVAFRSTFWPGRLDSDEAADLVDGSSTTVVKTSLGQLRGIVSGDFGMALPWAAQPIGFAVGTEFRKYKATQASDLLAKTPGELGGAGGANPDIKGGYAVYEGYAELIAPIVEDRPGFESLTWKRASAIPNLRSTVRVATLPGPGRPAAAGNRARASRSAAITARRSVPRTLPNYSNRKCGPDKPQLRPVFGNRPESPMLTFGLFVLHRAHRLGRLV